MTNRVSRRGFLRGSLAAAVGSQAAAGYESPTFHVLPQRVHPAIACSTNGLGKPMETALKMIEEGADTLDAAVAAVNIVENDPNDMSVGYGGIPNEDGIVELDASCMHGPSGNAGSVASIRNIKNPASVAKDVLWQTDHVMIVGEGALRFARAMGYKEENLLTEKARKRWLEWKRSLSRKDDWLEPDEKRPKKPADKKDTKRETGTINFDVCNAKGEVSGVTTTSGLGFKIPGRIGDSPIIGAGLFVDGRVGAAGATGRGESVIISCGSHVVVEAMRRGVHPTDACLEGVRRLVEVNRMPYLWKNGRPAFHVNFYAVDTKGRVGGASVYPSSFGCADKNGPRKADAASIY